ncbi:glycosyltransferase [Poseidonibacter lekithochrous]|uniref:glycosyltransferase n=1 Tax=Poseidonibacter TaxID=2321187 RepID=UPI001C0964FF|nr:MULTISPECIES: glycosyltransferase [Poseidonibacter]MBU3015750.1 glycosyltransferase [Poseidonibacter lekithochrous]MDO6829050.1 glycosyltransferase [Poseidonibacter sp. 1_MG-2023]
MKKLLIVIPTLNTGGAEHQTINMINFFKNHFEVFIIVLSSNIDLIKNLEIENTNIFVLKTNYNTFSLKKILSIKIFDVVKEISNLTEKIKPDIIFANLPITHYILRLVKYKSNHKFKLVNIHRSLQFKAHAPNVIMKIFMKFNSFLANKYDYLNIFISNACRNDQLNYLKIPLEKTKIIYNGIKSVDINDKFILNDLSTDSFNIITVGRFVPEKNQEFLIKVLINAFDNKLFTKKIKVYFLGEGPLKIKCEDLTKKSTYIDNFIFLGNVNNEKVHLYFAKSDLTVIPSKSEGFGNIAVEAGLAKAKILSSNVGGLDEIIEENINGFKFTSENASDLEKQLIEIINDNKDLDRNLVRENMLNKFSFNNMINKYKEVIDNA